MGRLGGALLLAATTAAAAAAAAAAATWTCSSCFSFVSFCFVLFVCLVYTHATALLGGRSVGFI
jgi:hypothetical protein